MAILGFSHRLSLQLTRLAGGKLEIVLALGMPRAKETSLVPRGD